MKTLLKFSTIFLLAGALWASEINKPPTAVACVGTPGATLGAHGQECQVAVTGARWACNNAAGCALVADWVAVTGSGGGTSIGTYTVSTLPSTPTDLTLAVVTDGFPDCGTGGGTIRVLCQYHGGWNTVGILTGINNTGVTAPNFNSTTPSAESGYTLALFRRSGTSVSVEYLTRKKFATWNLCAGNCQAGDTANWKYSAAGAETITGCQIDAVTYPIGAALTIDILKNPAITNSSGSITLSGGTTIFSSTVLTLADGSSAYSSQTGMAAAATLAQGNYLMAKVLTSGSTTPGQFANVVCTVTY